MKNPQIVILGGGLGGISCAYELAKRNIPCLLLEAAPELGGLAAVHNTGTYRIEKAYHAFFRGDHAMLETLEELGLSSQIVWHEVKLGFVSKGALTSFATPLDVLRNRQLGLVDKIKLFLLSYKMSRMHAWKHLDAVTATSWILENGTQRLYKELFEPILHVKWNGFKERISAAWIWGRIYPRATSRTRRGKDKCGYLLGSYAVALERMKEYIEKHGSRILTSAACKELAVKNNKVARVVYRYQDRDHVIDNPAVINTIQPPQFLKIAQGLPEKMSTALSKIKYEGVICLLAALKKPLTALCQIPIAPGQVRFGGIVEWGNFVPAAYFGGDHLLYLFTYGPTTNPDWLLTDGQIIEVYFSDLKKLIPSFRRDDVKWSNVFRNPYGTPIFETGYLTYMPEAISSINGLFFAGMFNTYPVNDFNNALLLARRIADHLGTVAE